MLTCFTFRPTTSFWPTSGTGGWICMAEYRVYLVDSYGHFFEAVHLICADDAEATEQAKALAVGHGVELWELDRKVGVFPAQNESP